MAITTYFILKGEDGEIDIEALKEKYGEDFEEFHTAHGAHVMKWVSEGDGDPSDRHQTHGASRWPVTTSPIAVRRPARC